MPKNSIFYFLKKELGKGAIKCFGYLIELFNGKIIFASTEKIKGVKELEENYKLILEEYNAICKKREIPGIEEFFVEQKTIAQERSWRSFPLLFLGHEYLDNTQLCPITRNLLTNIDGMCSAMFSILSAGQEIPPHCGYYKGILRLHLGLIIPGNEENCYIEINGVRKGWENGKCICFDDTHIHEAANKTDKDRVVLFIDIIRPLPFPLNRLNKLFFSALEKSEFVLGAISAYQEFQNFRTKKNSVHF